MNNTLNNYQPNNKLYKYILLAVLSIVAFIYYMAFRLNGAVQLEWYDWVTCGALAASVFFSYINARRYDY